MSYFFGKIRGRSSDWNAMKTNLKSLRKSRNMTQAQLAAEIGATKRQIGAWERGENDLPLDYACNIANVLGYSLDDISGRMSYAIINIPSEGDEREERELVSCYRNMDEQHRATLLDTARAFSALSEKDEQIDAGAERARTVDALI